MERKNPITFTYNRKRKNAVYICNMERGSLVYCIGEILMITSKEDVNHNRDSNCNTKILIREQIQFAKS